MSESNVDTVASLTPTAASDYNHHHQQHQHKLEAESHAYDQNNNASHHDSEHEYDDDADEDEADDDTHENAGGNNSTTTGGHTTTNTSSESLSEGAADTVDIPPLSQLTHSAPRLVSARRALPASAPAPATLSPSQVIHKLEIIQEIK